ncbi:UNVERIFIED_CONTAM: hypothetical protein GTU68_035604 [Idotea baltica]|nr:hypothetical protein [Idotea baltica]
MVYASSFHEAFEDAAGFGWTVDKPTFNWAALCKARDAEVDRLENIYLNNALEGNGVTTYRQRAVLSGANEVTLADGTRLTAKTILIATGGRPSRLPIEGAELAIVSDDIFHLPEQPKTMVVLGGGYIAAEFACIFAGLGTQVTMVNRSPTILKAFDHDLQETLIEEMAKKGIAMRLGETPEAITEEGGKKRVRLKSGDTLEADVVFMATGRRPNTDGLGLEVVDIATGQGGEIPVDDYSQTSVPSIYAVGDVTDRAQLTPVAIREGAAFIDTVFNDTPTKPDHMLIPTAIFTQPEIGTVGLSETEARKDHDVEIYRAKFRPMLHTLSGRDEKMLMKIVVDKSNRKVLGVHILGHGAGEMIQCVGIAVKMGATKEDFDRTMAVHPTASEELVTMKTPVADT